MKIEKLEEMWMWCSTDDIDNRFDSINFAEFAEEYMPKLIAVAKAAAHAKAIGLELPTGILLALDHLERE